MIFPFLAQFGSFTLFVLRLVVASIFLVIGWEYARHPQERAKLVEMPAGVMMVVGMIEIIAAIMLIIGLFTQLAALLLSGIMVGAIAKKIFSLKTGYIGNDGAGWSYNLLIISLNLVFITIGPGSWVFF
jgi:putative oxidoreductase